jgi:hypothetical protein
MSEFCREVIGCGFSVLLAKCDEFGGTVFGKEGKEDEYIFQFCCTFMCLIILRISTRAINFCSSFNCLKGWSSDSKKHLSSSTSASSICFARKICNRDSSYEIFVRFFFRTFRRSSFSFSSSDLLASSSSSFLSMLKLLCVLRSSM